MIRVGRRISQVDVARAAGVSTAVVSTVVNGRTDGPIRVSEATRERVLAAVEELGYVPDPAARRLVGARSQVIGVFTYEAVFPLAARSFYHDFLIGIEQAAEEADQDLLLVTSSRRAASQRSLYATGVNGLRLADGGLLFGSSIVEADVRRLASEGYPFVFIGERRLPDVELSFVAADYVGATSALVRRSADLGHERIGFVRQGEDVVTGRYAGFVAGVQERDLPLHVFELRSERIEQVPAWVRQHDLTCIFMQGRTSLGLVEPVLAEAGIRVPADLSVVSLGGYPDRLADRMVTHLSIPRLEMGREGVRLLMELTDNPARAPRRARLSCEIADGETLVEPTR
ncbi:LacI family DNA-binding transcriptional regulator [Parenemella sanctibonifatiensis]|nr:LacI family DNA-binding transcriptional regulator [Parenemella sanctibonifatiensis]